MRTEELNKSKNSQVDSTLSSLCTKWMQLNEALEILQDVNATKCDDVAETMANGTVNKFILYSMLDEFKLNDDQNPSIFNINIQRKKGYIGLGFISHILDEKSGFVYILDVLTMPDPVIMYGDKPKPLSHTPRPGELFGYLFQNKYLVRAIRMEYERSRDMSQKNQYTALLIDIGCKICIDIDSHASHLFEVTEEARKCASFAKAAHLINIPPNVCIYDLLHARVQYKVLCNEGDYMLADILNEGADPFKQLDQWNFYMYFMGQNLDDMPRLIERNKNRKAVFDAKSAAAAEASKQSHKTGDNYNPFADPEMYEIKNVPIIPLTDKANPFYSDLDNLNSSKQLQPKCVNFKVTKILANSSKNIISKMDERRVDIKTKALNHDAEHYAKLVNVATSIPGSATDFANFGRNVEHIRPLKDSRSKTQTANQASNMETISKPKIISNQQSTEVQKSVLIPYNESKTAELKSIPAASLNVKAKPFYSDSVADTAKETNKLNINVTNTMIKVSNDADKENIQLLVPNTPKTDDNHLRMKEKLEKEPKNCTGAIESIPNASKDLEHFDRRFQRIQHMVEKKSVDHPLIDLQPATNAARKEKTMSSEPIKEKELPQPAKPKQTAPSIQRIQSVASQQSDFLPPPNPPSIGDSVEILYQQSVSVEEFYAVIPRDPARDGFEVNEFTIYFNSNENVKGLQQYDEHCQPKLNERVVALYEESFYRAKVISIIDEHVFQVFYVDYGTCAKVNTLHLFKYDAQKWDEYPAYALHFRINRVKEIDLWDYNARWCLEQIMASECRATVVNIEHCEKTQRTTYVVDLEDENRLDIAETLIHKNLARFDNTAATHHSKKPIQSN